MRRIVLAMVLAVVLVVATLANATNLVDRGNGLIWDPDFYITWYDFTYMGPAGVGATWDEAIDWASGLTVGGTSAGSWRLPTALNPDGSGPCFGWGPCNESEMGHLFYAELGLGWYEPVSSSNQFPFTNLEPFYYWSGTEYETNPEVEAWYFSFGLGDPNVQFAGIQSSSFKAYPAYYVLAVYPGDVGAPVPEPSTFLLLGGGLAGLIWGGRKRK